MKRRSIGLFICAILLLSSVPALANPQKTEQGTVECYKSSFYGMKEINEKALSYEKLDVLDKRLAGILNSDDGINKKMNETLNILKNAAILPENFDSHFLSLLRKEWGWGILNYVISYGKGEIYIPLKSDRSFLRLLLRPIFFKYNIGFTMTKFGATYIWDRSNVVGNMGFMLGRQRGFMVGFIGLHVRIPHKLNPDSHLFIGAAIMINGNNLLF